MPDLPRHRRPLDEQPEPIDFERVLADERAISLLAGHPSEPADLDDRTLTLLAAWAAAARRDEFASRTVDSLSVDKTSGPRRFSAKVRGTIGGALVTAALVGVGGGVAAAVAGDPLAGLRGWQAAAMGPSIQGNDGSALRLSRDGAWARHQLQEAKDQAKSGNVVAAQKMVQDAQQTLSQLSPSEQGSLSAEASQVSSSVNGSAVAAPPVPAHASPSTSASSPVVGPTDQPAGPTAPAKTPPQAPPTSASPKPSATQKPTSPSTTSPTAPSPTSSGSTPVPTAPTPPSPTPSTSPGSPSASPGDASTPGSKGNPSSSPSSRPSATGTQARSSTAESSHSSTPASTIVPSGAMTPTPS